MTSTALDPAEFLRIAGSALGRGGIEEFARNVTTRWSPRQICPVLRHDDPDLRKLACVALAISGDATITRHLARTLQDPEEQVAQLAEQALWAIWFRGGNLDSRKQLNRGLAALKASDHARATDYFLAAQSMDPDFAEAYNQCGTVYYLQEQWVEAIEQHERSLQLNPIHFGAMGGLGHCHFQLGNFAEAARWYRRGLAIHPSMPSATTALANIDDCLSAV